MAFVPLLESFLCNFTWPKEKALIFAKYLFYAGTVLEYFCILCPLILAKLEENDVQESSGNLEVVISDYSLELNFVSYGLSVPRATD